VVLDYFSFFFSRHLELNLFPFPLSKGKISWQCLTKQAICCNIQYAVICILVLQASQNQYIDTTLQVTTVGKKLQTLNTKEDILRIFLC